jgi:hypothetical protein
LSPETGSAPGCKVQLALLRACKINPETLKPEHPEYTPGSVSLRHRMIGLGIRFLEGNAEITM